MCGDTNLCLCGFLVFDKDKIIGNILYIAEKFAGYYQFLSKWVNNL